MTMKTNNSPAVSPRVVALGVSAEGLQDLSAILAKLPASFPAPIVISHHLSPHSPSQIADSLSRRTALRVKEAKEGDPLQAGAVYVAPPAKHLMVRPDGTLALSGIHEARPAVDVLFSSLASSVRARAIGVVLAGRENIGAAGIRAIKAAGGVTLAQDEKTRENSNQPRHAAARGDADFVLTLSEIATTLIALVSEPSSPQSSLGVQSEPAAQPEAIKSTVILHAPAPFAANALDRVQAAWRSAEDFPGDGAGTQHVSRLTTKALEELDDCVDTLRFAEKVLVAQNEAMERLQQTMREERLRYQALLGVVSDAVITTDLPGIIRAVNPAAARLLGRNAKYMVGRPLNKYAQHGQHLTAGGEASQALEIEDKRQTTDDKRQTLCLRTRSGTTAVSATASAIEHQDGMVIGLHWLVRCEAVIDVTA